MPLSSITSLCNSYIHQAYQMLKAPLSSMPANPSPGANPLSGTSLLQALLKQNALNLQNNQQSNQTASSDATDFNYLA